MANKRQRLAKKRFQELHPERVEKSLKRRTEDGDKDRAAAAKSAQEKHGKKRGNAEDGTTASRKKLKSNAKVADTEGNAKRQEPVPESSARMPDGKDDQNKKREKVKRKHPLRMPGQKPGDGCFMCKSKDHIEKDCPQKFAQDRKKICLGCRQWGHTLKSCPNEFTQDAKFCYNCGNKGHRLVECKKPLKDGGTSFAECFLCKGTGHLSKNCPSNTHGIYPKGGSCKICGGVTHLAKDCPDKGKAKPGAAGRSAMKISAGGALASSRGGKRTVFASGDDLEDDYNPAGTFDDVVSDQENESRKDEKKSSKPTKQSGKAGKSTGDGPLKPLQARAHQISSRIVRF